MRVNGNSIPTRKPTRCHAKLRGSCGKAVCAKNDRVVLVSENQPEWCIAYLAVVQLGAAVVPLDAQTPTREILAIAEFTDAKSILASDKCVRAVWFDPLNGRTGCYTTSIKTVKSWVATPRAAILRMLRYQPISLM